MELPNFVKNWSTPSATNISLYCTAEDKAKFLDILNSEHTIANNLKSRELRLAVLESISTLKEFLQKFPNNTCTNAWFVNGKMCIHMELPEISLENPIYFVDQKFYSDILEGNLSFYIAKAYNMKD